ncbi:hypothetical protein PybrP1_001785 [[Pythium] brassicae (nom. inval.)]|nr:hypothetical protein PybrP1_001785 [[Pythium] brassicae (nom. inval.)]
MSAQRSPSRSLRFTISAEHWTESHESRSSEGRVVIKREDYADDKEASGGHRSGNEEAEGLGWDEAGEDSETAADHRGPHGASVARRGGNRRHRIHFEISELQKLYHLPLKTAAKQLGICEAALKRICRRNQIRKWPYRQLQSIHRRMIHLEDAENGSCSAGKREQLSSPARPPKAESKLSKGKKLGLLEEERRRVIALAHRASRNRPGRLGVVLPPESGAPPLEPDTPFSFEQLLVGSIKQHTLLEAGGR